MSKIETYNFLYIYSDNTKLLEEKKCDDQFRQFVKSHS